MDFDEKRGSLEADFQKLAECIMDGILIAGVDGKHIYANENACHLFGYSKTEMLETCQKDLADPEAFPMLQKRLLDRIAGRSVPDNYETKVRRKDGSNFIAEIRGTKITWRGEACDMVLIRDVSVRVQAVQALKASEEVNRLFFEHGGDGMLFTNPDGTIYSANPMACKILGMTEQEIRSLGRAGIMDMKDPRLRIALDQRQKRGQFTGELNMVRGDGTIFPAELSSTLFKDTHGGIRTSMLFRDISERKRMEGALHQSRRELATLMNNLPGMVYSCQNSSDWRMNFVCEGAIIVSTNRKGIEGEPSAGLGLLLCKEFVEKQGGNLWVTSI